MTRVDQSGTGVAAKRIDFTYDAASQFDTLTRYADLASTELVAVSDYTFDDAGRITDLSHVQGLTTLADYDWTYDLAGRATQFTSATDGTADYTYDDTNQLTDADYSYQTDEAHTYDAIGNRTTSGYATGDANRLLADGTYTYTYDANGNRTARFVDTDSSGTLNAGDTSITEYTWDHRNRLTNVTDRATHGGAATQTVDYVYDAFNRLIHKELDADGDGTGTATDTFWIHDGDQTVLQFDGDTAADLSHRYLWGNAVDQLLADETVDDGGAEDVLWPLTDNLGTVRDLATYDDATDTTTIANHKAYDAFGNVTNETNSAVDTLFGYTGRMWDDDTGQQNNLNRWYDPTTGRWISEDPIGFAAGDANLSRYVGNNVTGAVDPSGLDTLRIGNSMRGEVIWDAPQDSPAWWYPIYEGLTGQQRASKTFDVGTIEIGDGSFVKGLSDAIDLGSTNDLKGYAKVVNVSDEYGGGQVPYRELQAAVRKVNLAGLTARQQQQEIQRAIDSVRAGDYHSETPAIDKVMGAVDYGGQWVFDWFPRNVPDDEGCRCYSEGEIVEPRLAKTRQERRDFREWRQGWTGQLVDNCDGPAYHRGGVVARAVEHGFDVLGAGALPRFGRAGNRIPSVPAASLNDEAQQALREIELSMRRQNHSTPWRNRDGRLPETGERPPRYIEYTVDTPGSVGPGGKPNRGDRRIMRDTENDRWYYTGNAHADGGKSANFIEIEDPPKGVPHE